MAATAQSAARVGLAVPRLIMPRWWTGTPPLPPSAYTIDVAQYPPITDPAHPPSELKDKIMQTYEKIGAVLLRNTGLEKNLADMGKLARIPMGGSMIYEAGANPRSFIGDNVFDVGAPEAAHLHYHHEMAYTADSVRCLGFCIQSAIQGGTGSTFISHSVGTTDDILQLDVGRKLRDKGVTYIRCLTDRNATSNASGVYNHWQKSFGTEDPEEAKAIAESKGLYVEFGPGRYMRTAYTVSAFEYHEPTDRNHLYSSLADDGMWFDGWPGVMELPPLPSYAEATPAQRPLKMTYGDGTPFSEKDVEDYVDVYDRHGIPLRWQAGDIAVICNLRFAHGRPGFATPEGAKRSIGVVLGPKFRRQGPRPRLRYRERGRKGGSGGAEEGEEGDGASGDGRKVESLPNGTACEHNLDCASGCCLIRLNSHYSPFPQQAGSCVVEALPGQVCGLMAVPLSGRWGEWGIPGTYHRDYRKDFFPNTVWSPPQWSYQLPSPATFQDDFGHNRFGGGNHFGPGPGMGFPGSGPGMGMGGPGMGMNNFPFG